MKPREERRINDTANPAPRQEPPLNRPSGFTLVDHASMADFERRWHAVQADFVEDPRRAVGEAGNLMAELMDHVSKNLRQRRTELGKDRDGESDTEAMRLEMRRYKELMNRMLHGDGAQPAVTPQPARPQAPVSTERATQAAPQNRPPANPRPND